MLRIGAAREHRVGIADLCEGIGELVCEVAHRDPSEDLSTLGRDPRVATTALSTELLEHLLALGHLPHCAPAPLRSGTETFPSPFQEPFQARASAYGRRSWRLASSDRNRCSLRSDD